MNIKEFSDAMSEIDSKYVDEAIYYKKKRKKNAVRSRWIKWGSAAACLCLLCIGGLSLSHVFRNPLQPSAPQGNPPPVQKDTFVAISSLLAGNTSISDEAIEENAAVPIGQYRGIYVKTVSLDSEILSQSIGNTVSETQTWYYVSGHRDLQYLIQNDNDEFSLWKFKCFDSDEYPYSDVLKLVYQIDSANIISDIEVNPTAMDNTDSGKAVQAEIGTHTITDRGSIETIYQILSSLTCYGENQWGRIDYGDVEAAADEDTPSKEAVWLSRSLTLKTNYGNEIDGLMYTAVSNMFYEYSGIAYHSLTEEQNSSVCQILHIEKTAEDEPAPVNKNDVAQSPQTEETSVMTKEEPANAAITLEYVTELQTKVSTAMSNGELSFVSSSAVYENPYRLHVVVSSNADHDLAKLKAFDTIGGALEIKYDTNPIQVEDMETGMKTD